MRSFQREIAIFIHGGEYKYDSMLHLIENKGSAREIGAPVDCNMQQNAELGVAGCNPGVKLVSGE